MTIATNRIKWKPPRRLYYRPQLILLEDRTLPSFVAPLSYETGPGAVSVAVRDFNGDGILDLAVANQGSSDVSVLLGNGDGTVQTARNFATGSDPQSVVVGDFNGDGNPDLAVVDYNNNAGTVDVLLGNGDGTFRPARSYAAGGNLRSVAVGDFNGDGIQDLAIANRGNSPPLFTDGNVSVLVGNGDGTFKPATTYAAGPYPTFVAVGDFNGDGIQDLSVLGLDGVRVLLGNGDGTFQTSPFSYVVGPGPSSLAVGDFNGDGWANLAVATGFNSVSILLNDGNWPSIPQRSNTHVRQRSATGLHALATALPPQQEPVPFPAAAYRRTDPALPPPDPAPGQHLPETPADSLPGVTPRPMPPPRVATAPDLLESDLPWTDWPPWVA
jgi:hypothetical protein